MNTETRELRVVLNVTERGGKVMVNADGSIPDKVLMIAYAARDTANDCGLSTSQLLNVIAEFVTNKENRGEW